MSGPIRILAVDDSLVVRSLLGRLIDSEPDLQLASTASDGRRCVDKLATVKPDVVVLDVEMPVMTGVEALVEIRKIDPELPVIMFSNLTRTGAATTLEALALGAKDYSPKPQGSDDPAASFAQIRNDLFPKIRQAHQIRTMRAKRRAEWATSASSAEHERRAADAAAPARPTHAPVRASSDQAVEAVVLGASTGGPVALETVLRSIKQPLPVPLVVVQHMPAVFTKALADRLDTKVPSTVLEAEDGQQLEPGTCYIAPGGKHLALESHTGYGVRVTTNTEPTINGCRPSVEPLFESAAKIYGSRLAAVMLTGVGRDGSVGAASIAAQGSPVIVQDEATSVVWGMPGAIAAAGHASAILPIEDIGTAIAGLRMAGRVSAV